MRCRNYVNRTVFFEKNQPIRKAQLCLGLLFDDDVGHKLFLREGSFEAAACIVPRRTLRLASEDPPCASFDLRDPFGIRAVVLRRQGLEETERDIGSISLWKLERALQNVLSVHRLELYPPRSELR